MRVGPIARTVRCTALVACLMQTRVGYTQELVPNGSFESCVPSCGLSGQFSFNASVTAWTSPTIGSPDLFHASLPEVCPNTTAGSTDAQSWGAEVPYNGDAMIAVITYCAICPQETREYAQVQLTEPLVPGTVYHARMFVSRAERTRYATDGLGLHCSVNAIGSADWSSLAQMPQVVITSSEGWTLIAGDFIATDAHQYLTIGNFHDDATITAVNTGSGALDYAVYFVDAVSLTVAGQGPYVTGDAVICAGGTATLTAHNTIAPQWSTAAQPDVVLSTELSFTVAPTVTTSYLLTSGAYAATFTVQVLPTPAIALGNDTTLCIGTTLQLDAAQPGASYQWSDGSTEAMITVAEPGTYSVLARIGDCSAMDSIVVAYVEGPPLELGNDTTLCPGATLVLDATTTAASYLWQDGSTAPTYTVLQDGLYTVQASDALCTTVDSIVVNYETLPLVGATGEVQLCTGDALRYQYISPATGWLWDDGSTAQPTYLSTAGIHSVTVFTALCQHTAVVVINLVECEPLMRMPNVISPNGDGLNDIFLPLNYRGFAQAELSIYNRWGNVLHTTSDLQRGWTARDVPEGTYYWIVVYTDVDGVKGSAHGTVTVVR
jgi:gliding motility-associated-like protein